MLLAFVQFLELCSFSWNPVPQHIFIDKNNKTIGEKWVISLQKLILQLNSMPFPVLDKQ